MRVSTAVLSADESAAVYGVPLATTINPARLDRSREPRRPRLLSAVAGPRSEFLSRLRSGRSGCVGRVAGAEGGARPALSPARVPQPCPSWRHDIGVRADEPRRGFQARADRPGRERAGENFSILSVVPGFRADYHASEVFRREIYPPEEIVNYTDDAAFRAALEALPCCATNEDGSKNGDPLNLVVVGGLDDAFPAFVRRGWRPTEEKWSGSITKMVTSALAGERYPVCTGERPLPVRPGPGPRAAEGARQHPPAQPPAALAEPDALPRQAGVGGPDQPRHRQSPDHSFADAHDAQDRSRRRRSTRGAGAGHGLFAEPCQDRVREGRRSRPQERPARQPHDRPLLHRRLSRRPRVRPPADLAG